MEMEQYQRKPFPRRNWNTKTSYTVTRRPKWKNKDGVYIFVAET